ncbi:extracellular solute-binding protein [Thermofilum pendens]|uniref:Extracellular solute-binding protein, family 1 n=1 Tax=Thermofilum pendens (strain DSM 2475 / Hrk 5) TaxID=368408 RepID=A1RZ25_THEPD|nr:extracellular solute-binding protein [Thermofilum pendens]ABL78455.1 extracellular solute-binding protein, family 1 [Thermofilum pendens Hrk 5]
MAAQEKGKKGVNKLLIAVAVLVIVALAAVALYPMFAPKPAPKQVKITIWTAWTGGEYDALKAVIDDFRAKNPNYQIDIVNVPFDQLKNKVIQAVPVGEGPDLFTGPHDWTGELVQAGALVDITDKVSAFKGEYMESALQGVTLKGKIYGLPESIKLPALIVNKKLLATPPKTLDELWSIMDQFKAKGMYGLAYDVQNAYFSSCWFYGLGAYYLDPNTLETALDSPGAVQAFQIIAKFSKYLPPDISYDMMTNLFMNGKAAMAINGPWWIGDLKKAFGENLADIEITLIPAIDPAHPARPFMTVEAVFVTKNAAERGVLDEAIALAHYITGEASVKLAKMAGHVPTWKNAMKDPAVSGDKVISAFFKQAEYGVPMPNVPEVAQMWNVVPKYISQVYQGQLSPQDAAKAAAQELRAALKK